MTSDSTRYVLSEQSYNSQLVAKTHHKVQYQRVDLDLGTKDLHTIVINFIDDSTLSNGYTMTSDTILHPADTTWNEYVNFAAYNIHEIWKYDTFDPASRYYRYLNYPGGGKTI